MRNMRRFYLSPHSDPGNPSANNTPAQQPAQQAPAQQPDPQAAFQSLLDRNANDAQRVAWLLYNDNHAARSEARDLQTRVLEMQNQMVQLQQQVPTDGSVVLSGELVNAWTRYQALGTPEDIATLQRSYVLRDAAEAHEYKVSVLQTLANNLTLELRPNVEGGGQTAYVVTGENQATPLPEYVQKNWPDFLPALENKPQSLAFPKQTIGSPLPNGNAVQAELNRHYAIPKEK
ncbi:MAG: hypothetical protein IPM39_24925 [Chloroflexi bacterium]|nr:hypothetical protein [Chloroflexota bacterium]